MNTQSSSKKNIIPRWNLDSIYADLHCPSYKKALADFSSGMDRLDKLLSSPADDFPSWLAAYIDIENETGAVEESIAAYAYIIYSTDTTNKEYLDNISAVEEMELRSRQQEISFRAVLKAHESELPSFYKKHPQYKDYAYIIRETIDDTKHQMSASEENLAADLQRTGGDAWGRLHEQIISNLKDGKTGKTFNELRNDAYDTDPAVRKSSWEKEKILLEMNRIPIAAALDNLKGETVTLNRRRHWDEAIDRALASSRMSRTTLNALIEAIQDSLPVWRSYFQYKASLLRTAHATADTDEDRKNPGLSFYDLFAPLPSAHGAASDPESPVNRTWTFEEAKSYIISEYSSFSTDMGGFAEKAFASGWIDAEVRSGKVGGAYCQDFPVQKESRILSNFTGAFSDIITLAHELGHAYHHECICGRDYLLSSYPMTLAETASTFAETIVKHDAASHTSGSDKSKLIELDLQDAAQVLVDILCRYYFEQSVFAERAEGELTADDFCRLMAEAQNRTYGDGLDNNRHEYMWAVKSHYYSTGLDFYNFPYAFGQLFAAALYARYKKEGPAFAETYRNLLADTGMMSCEDLCRKAGFDITRKEFWKTGIDVYTAEFRELQSIR
jgi:oligoendopeptidase F